MIDSHAHLNFKAFADDYQNVIQLASLAGVEKILIVGAAIESSMAALKIAREETECFASVGIHPHHLKEFNDLGREKVREQLAALLKDTRVVAIGETGIDYHRYQGYPATTVSEKDDQKELLFLHLQLAIEYSLPIIFHCREAFTEMLPFLVQSFKRLNCHPKGVFHCFSGTKQDLEHVLEMGFYVGFDGNITYEENNELRELVRLTPFDRLLLETDSPFLTPVPYRGQRNEPQHTGLVAQCIAAVRDIPLSSVKKQTRENTLSIFPKMVQ